MKPRLIALALVAGLASAAVPALADGSATPAPKPQVTDPAGDANGINDQDTVGQSVSQPTPVDDSAADITSVVFQTTFVTKTTTTIVKKKKVVKTVKTPNGFTVTLNLSAAPDSNTSYDLRATNPGCKAGYVDFGYSSNAVLGLGDVNCFPNDPTSIASTTYNSSVAVKGSSITWTLPATEFPVGSVFTGISAETDTAALIGVIDQAAGTGTYAVGS
jgi:hypothetical protein